MENKRRKSKKWWWIGGIVLVLIVGAVLGLRQLRQNFEAQIAAAQTGDIVTAFTGDLSASATASGQLTAERDAQLALGTSGTVAEIFVTVGDEVAAGDALLRLDTTALERNVQSAEQALIIQEANLETLMAPPSNADIASAEASVASAQASLDDLLAGPSADEIAAAEADVRAANADIAAAQARVGTAVGSTSESAIQAAEIELELAQAAATSAAEQHSTILVTDNEFLSEEQLADLELSARTAAVQANANLAAAQEALDQLLNGDPYAITGAQAGVASAAAQRDAAQARLDQLLAGASSAQIASAESSLAQAQASLANVQRGQSESQIANAEIQVEQARISLQRAQNALAEATLVAPFAGTVTAVHVHIGEQANGILVELVETDKLEVVLDVDEVDIGQITIGQEAIITRETWPNEEIMGQVTAIAPQATNGNALVTYEVFVGLRSTDLPVRVGMTANANLVTANREGVLLLPNAAINADREAGTYSVNLVERNAEGVISTTEVEVTIGLRDGRYTQITDGLNESDEVMIGNVLPVFQFGNDEPPNDGNGGGSFGGG
jgi:HlyD family secretion protein